MPFSPEGILMSGFEGDIRRHGRVSEEDVLYHRTINCVHTMAKKLMPLTAVRELVVVSFENGCPMSFKHIGDKAAAGEGGVRDWLEAGYRTWQRALRERAYSPPMRKLFPRGVPFALMGDGSNDRSKREQEAAVFRFIGADGRPFNSFGDLAELDLALSVDGRSPDAQATPLLGNQ